MCTAIRWARHHGLHMLAPGAWGRWPGPSYDAASLITPGWQLRWFELGGDIASRFRAVRRVGGRNIGMFYTVWRREGDRKRLNGVTDMNHTVRANAKCPIDAAWRGRVHEGAAEASDTKREVLIQGSGKIRSRVWGIRTLSIEPRRSGPSTARKMRRVCPSRHESSSTHHQFVAKSSRGRISARDESGCWSRGFSFPRQQD